MSEGGPIMTGKILADTGDAARAQARRAHEQTLARRQKLIDAGAYDPSLERAACGVGMVANVHGVPEREVVTLALAGLKSLWHRGAVDADGLTGDGAGLRIDVPQEFFRKQITRTGHKPRDGDICVGMAFLPRTDLVAQDRARTIVESKIIEAGLNLYGWRQVPVRPGVIGPKADATRPEIEQVLFYDPTNRSPVELEKALFLVRRAIEKRADAEGLKELYLCSLSARSLVYKGLFLAEQIESFYPDLSDPAFTSVTAIFHQRYSTNTFPEWRLAQPFRLLAHNGEINTLNGNRNWMASHEIGLADDAFGEQAHVARPIIPSGASDSAALDAVFEALCRGGREAPMVKAMLLPEAWSKRDKVTPEAHRDLYSYCNSIMEPWDGPAAIAACDGRWAVAGLDRNGLRPLRWALTKDGLLTVGSEAGMTPLEDERVAKRGAVPQGGMIGIDFETQSFFEGSALVDHVASQAEFSAWAKKVVHLEKPIGEGPEPDRFDADERLQRMRAAGVTLEDVNLVLSPMINDAKEAIGSMGDDAAPAVLSRSYRPLSHYFRQRFSQVTNPPIDPIREGRVMSLKTRFDNLGAVRGGDGPLPEIFSLEGPILTNGMFIRLAERMGEASATLDCTFAKDEASAAGAVPGGTLGAALDALASDAEQAVRDGARHLVLTDIAQSQERAPLPMILVAAAVHRRLLESGLRRQCAITVCAGECFDPHYCAVLIGVGATCVNPYLAFDAAGARAGEGLHHGRTRESAAKAVKDALETGLLKILSKSGISVLSAYRGGCLFEALGLSRILVDRYFPGMISRISGIGLAGIERDILAQHDKAWAPVLRPKLEVGGFHQLRASGEDHAVTANTISLLQRAARYNDAEAFEAYVDAIDNGPEVHLRDLLDFSVTGKEIPLSEVEPASQIFARMVTPGMSLGALSPEAHGVLNAAMNRLGGRSVSGEGGEDPARYVLGADGENLNSAVKQIASGRFGVTAEYLNQAEEIEIKVAQGAKPGEGGQLPGHKVTEFIARMRHSEPGVTLISPPPHHDIYSIEDLAQLIYDLKQINPDARVAVKLVSSTGVGTIAAGVVKANADTVHIAGHNGGTGASPLSSIKFAGLPWEIGLSEAHQILSLNGLRDRVRLRTDGGLRTGRDIVIAAMLGAEEFAVGTAALIAIGCLMVRQCHSNTCPVGVCTQDEELRRRFEGKTEHVVNMMTFIAQDVRRRLAQVGARSIADVVGRTDMLAQVSRGAPQLDDLDFNPLLARVDEAWRPADARPYTPPAPTLDDQILVDGARVFERGEQARLAYTIRNVERSVGARVSSHIVRANGPEGLPEGRLTVRLVGAAGQSFGAFGAPGLRLELEGEANDYVGKGLSGAQLVIWPSAETRRKSGLTDSAIVGNTCLYGATSGTLFAAGAGGERFGVRNSGAKAVVEGLSANGCEYMTGGAVVVLGPVGDNFAAGMTGGEAFIYDPDGRADVLVNADDAGVLPLDDAAAARCGALIEAHVTATNSQRGRHILDNWADERGRFSWVLPIARAQDILAAQNSDHAEAAE